MSAQKHPHWKKKAFKPLEQKKPEKFEWPIFSRTIVAVDDNLHTNINRFADNAGLMEDSKKRRLAYGYILGGYVASGAIYANSPRQLAVKLVTSGIIAGIAVFAVRRFSKTKEAMEKMVSKEMAEARRVAELMRLGVAVFAGYNFLHFVAFQDAISAAQGIMATALTFALYLVTPKNIELDKKDE